MNQYDIRSLYEREGRDAALSAYPQAIEENKGDEEKLNELAFLAADFADPAALRLLFEAGVSPAAADDYAFTLLHYLARQEESKYHVKPAGAVAEATSLLLDNKVSALRKDENESMTCYHYAARNGLAEIVETLAQRGAKLNMTDKDGNTGIHIAAEYVRHAVSDIDYKKRELEQSQKHYDETVERCKSRDMTEEQIAQYIKNNLTNPPEKAQKSYDAAVQKVEDYFRVVKAFAGGGVDIDEKNSYGKSALDIAVESGARKIAAYLSGALDESNDATVAAGGMTLHQAAERGDTEAIKAIAGTGVDLNALKDGEPHQNGGCTPLAIAVLELKNDAAEALLACGADPSFRDGSGRAAASFLVRANINGPAFEQKYISKIIRNLISAGMDINAPVDDNSDTLLILACKSSRGYGYNRYTLKGEIVAETLKHNPDINLANRFGETALMHACADDFDIMENVQITLLEQGADVSASDQNGDTALHYAARNDDKNGAKGLCDMLLEFGADANAVNNAGQTALDIATEQDNEPLVKLLLGKM